MGAKEQKLERNQEQETATPVAIQQGTVIGSTRDGITSFLGIPYAKAFTGDRRWRLPEPIETFDKPAISAQKFGEPCPHTNKFDTKSWFTEGFAGSSDCLNLNIWTTKESFAERLKQKIPVMVFFPGGGFQVGSSSWEPFGLPIYHGANLAKLGKIIVVTLNYRTGNNGFFYEPGLAAREPMVGNLGHLDQIAALKWIKATISEFGGDPTNITAYGSSSGAMSVCNLIASPAAKDLFHKAIIASGSCWLSSTGYTTGINNKIVEKVGCSSAKSNEEKVACLLATSFEKMTAAEPEMDYQSPTLDNFKFSPVLDGAFFKTLPDEIIRKKQHNAMPILIGSNENEVPMFMMKNEKSAWDKLFSQWDEDAGEKNKIKQYYESRYGNAWNKMLARLKSDYFYSCRSRYFAELLASNQTPPVYLYHFDKNLLKIIDPLIKGSFHGMELYYVFQKVPPYSWLPGIPPHLNFQEKIGKLWAHFAYFGNVQSDEDWRDWTPYSATNRVAGMLGDFNGNAADPHGGSCELLSKVMKKVDNKVSLIE